jgi:hypothetical protein
MALRLVRSLIGLTLLLTFSTIAQSQQTVFLDFSGTDGSIAYTTAMKDEIEGMMTGHYADFGFMFTQAAPGAGPFSTITFNAGSTGGLAEHIDFRNVDKSDTAVVNVDGLGFTTTADLVSASANIGSHELGHLVGLRHGDSMGPIGSGISSTLGGGAYSPVYPGPTDAHVKDHIMSSPASVGSALSDLTTENFFSDRSYVKLEFNETGSLIAEAPGSKGSLAEAQTVVFDPLPGVGSTKIPHDGLALGTKVGAFAVFDAELSSPGESDYYEFEITAADVAAGAILNFEVISAVIGDRLPGTINSSLAILDDTGATVDYYGTGALNFDEFESTDSIIIDLLAADMGTGTFYAEVFAATGGDTGSYELFGYKLSAIPEPTSFVMFGVAICLLGLRRRTQGRPS